MKKMELPKRMNQDMEEAYREFKKRRREDDQKRRRMSYAAPFQFKLKIPDGGFTFDSLMNELVSGAGMIGPITSDGAMKTLKRIIENKPIDDTSESLTDGSNNIFEAVVENKPIDDTSESLTDGSNNIFEAVVENKPIDDTSESLTDGSNDIFEAVAENRPIDDTSDLNKLRSLHISENPFEEFQRSLGSVG